MKLNNISKQLCVALVAAQFTLPALAAVPADEAAALKSTLTPIGAEKAGNKEGSIPAWTGGFNQPYAGYTPGGRRPDPFADEKPLFSITAQNMAQYADKLSVGTVALLKKYPDYRLDIYRSVRTGRQTPEVAEHTFHNATATKLVGKPSEGVLTSYYGGTPFPIPKSGEEAMWNHLLRSRGDADTRLEGRSYIVGANGRRTLISDIEAYLRYSEGYANFKADNWDGYYDNLKVVSVAPAIRAGEQVLVRDNVNDAKSLVYTYLPGQRRVRRLPNACCDTPSAPTAGIANIDDTSVWTGRLDRFDWKLVGKKELYIPYNTNRFNVPANDGDVIGERFLKPEYVRWELHRVWVVEATLKPGQRHTSSKSVYYLDEDTWQAEIADRWDEKGQLWKHSFVLPVLFPDLTMTAGITFGFYDLLSNIFIINNVMNEKKAQLPIAKLPDDTWQPESMVGSGVR